MVKSYLRNLSVQMFSELTPGQIVDYCIEYNNILNSENDTERTANQRDFDRF